MSKPVKENRDKKSRISHSNSSKKATQKPPSSKRTNIKQSNTLQSKNVARQKTERSQISDQKKRKQKLMAKIKLLKINTKKAIREAVRTPFQRSPGPPPTSSIIPPPNFKSPRRNIRSQPWPAPRREETPVELCAYQREMIEFVGFCSSGFGIEYEDRKKWSLLSLLVFDIRYRDTFIKMIDAQVPFLSVQPEPVNWYFALHL